MTGWFWKDGRFGWPFVVAVVFVCVSILASDYAWRTLTMQFDTLLLVVAAANAAVIALIFAIYFALFRRRA